MRLVDKTIQQYGRLDVVVNNAGIRGGKALITELPDEDWDQVIATNLRGVYLLWKHALPFLVKQGGGSIVNISSVAGTVGFEKAAAYAAAKSAVIGLTKSLALDFAKQKVRANAVCPGICDTGLIRNVLKASEEPDTLMAQYISVHPIGRLGVAEDVANAVLFLVSDESSFVTGSCVMVDGGYTAR